MDGQKQRQALSAAERALQLLGDRRREQAVAAAEKAEALDQISAFAGLATAVDAAAVQLDEVGAIDGATRDQLANAVGPGPLQEVVGRLPGR